MLVVVHEAGPAAVAAAGEGVPAEPDAHLRAPAACQAVDAAGAPGPLRAQPAAAHEGPRRGGQQLAPRRRHRRQQEVSGGRPETKRRRRREGSSGRRQARPDGRATGSAEPGPQFGGPQIQNQQPIRSIN